VTERLRLRKAGCGSGGAQLAVEVVAPDEPLRTTRLEQRRWVNVALRRSIEAKVLNYGVLKEAVVQIARPVIGIRTIVASPQNGPHIS